jgi:UDP-N-acetylglucosamine--N-acetylmuramyl-(pentapeptide) pyrophosphoryl-undecaprenol N-acetylglucosamine transferase
MKVMYVCSTGGHLTELLHWSHRLRITPDAAVWLTHERSNSNRIAEVYPGASVRYVQPVEPKQGLIALRLIPVVRRILLEEQPDVVLSTGAAVAVPVALAARLTGIPFYYLESAARLDGPSLTGRLIRRIDRHHMWCQATPPWPGWRSAGSVFDAFAAEHDGVDRPITRVVVALGTQANFDFRAAVEAVSACLAGTPGEKSVMWQVGSTDVSGLDVDDPLQHVAEDELIAAIRAADVVITHAGVGLATLALENGKCPVLLPRRAVRGEHTDDHQLQLARFLDSRGLAVAAEVPDLQVEHLQRAQQTRIVNLTLGELSSLSLSPSD